MYLHIWAASRQNQQNDCAYQRLRSAWASAPSDESSLCAQKVANDPSFFHADSEDFQTGRMPRMIWVFAGRTSHFLGFWHEAAHLHYSIKAWQEGRTLGLFIWYINGNNIIQFRVVSSSEYVEQREHNSHKQPDLCCKIKCIRNVHLLHFQHDCL